MLNFALTLLCGGAFGYLFYKLKVPGGVLVGGIVGAAVLNIGFNAAHVPLPAKVLAQLTAGAFVGAGVNKSDLRRFRQIWRPALLLLLLYLVANVALGFAIYYTSPLDLLTSLFCAVPGGISEVPLVAEDMGANPTVVAAVQFVRLVVFTGLFPGMINRVCEKEPAQEINACAPAPNTKSRSKAGFPLTFAAAVLCGAAGYFSKIPAGTLVFSMFGIIALNIATGRAYLPAWVKRAAQLLSGVYIGGMMNLTELLLLRHLALPLVILLGGYTAYCFGVSGLLRRFFGTPRKEAMLTAIPSGGSDMALISLDMGVQSANLVLLQIIRVIAAMSIFPQTIRLICAIVA